jgi:hypothetical protein
LKVELDFQHHRQLMAAKSKVDSGDQTGGDRVALSS